MPRKTEDVQKMQCSNIDYRPYLHLCVDWVVPPKLTLKFITEQF